MSGRNFFKMIGIVPGLLALMVLSTNLSGAVYNNGGGQIFDPLPPPVPQVELINGISGPGEHGLTYEKNAHGPGIDSIDYYLVSASMHFLESHSHLKSFLSHVEAAELEGPNYGILQAKIKRTVDEMKKTMDYHEKLLKTIDKANYRPEMIEALKYFDYDAFKNRERQRVNEDIFARVKDYMKKGEIKQMYKDQFSEYKEILKIAFRIKERLERPDVPKFPEISDLWEIDYLFSQTYTFGKYAAQILAEINRKQSGKM